MREKEKETHPQFDGNPYPIKSNHRRMPQRFPEPWRFYSNGQDVHSTGKGNRAAISIRTTIRGTDFE